MSDTAYYIICAVLTLGILAGISLMSRVRSAVFGNRISAVCMAAAILVTLYKNNLLSDAGLWICLAIGLAIGIVMTFRTRMIEMPQLVALLNGLGGAASALVALVSLPGGNGNDFAGITASLALIVGLITLAGSLVAAGKLHKILPQKPQTWPAQSFITTSSIIAAFLALVLMAAGWLPIGAAIAVMVLASLLFGIAFAVRVGGADMPITISLLNSLSGVAGAIAGMAINDPLLVAVGGVVGASGLLLTQIMCKAMNRSLADILLGKTSRAAPRQDQDLAAAPAADVPAATQAAAEDEAGDQAAAGADPAVLLRQAKKVILVPGYGMALAQAQGLVKQLADRLESGGASVQYAIHPVAGRMPGHMNVLLCEADVAYESLHEMDEINPQFVGCDVVVVIGANDVINPAANTAENTPIYGMPVLDVGSARHIIICNYDLKPGYAGVENPLYTRTQGVTLLLGDASQTLAKLIGDLD